MERSFRYIAVEGPIGAGKTTLATKIAQDLSARLILEEAEKNPFLAHFYQNLDHKGGYAFQTQVFFLLSRFKQQQELSQQDLFSTTQVSDYIFAKDRIFAFLNLEQEEISLYEKIYQTLDTRVVKPDLVIFLQASLETLKARIKNRGVAYEKQITDEYLENLCQAYNQFFFQYNEAPLLTINCSEIDIINEEADYKRLIREIANMEKSKLTRHYVSISSKK